MKRFTKTQEDFVCLNCKTTVQGNGYTNHCPQCLFSQHVDIFPGDRQQPCGGLMEPIGLTLKNQHYILTHQCKKCGSISHCKSSEKDNIDSLTQLSETIAKKTFF
jgi:Zn finger protein HypA/HybF involved in hydrogenase expression